VGCEIGADANGQSPLNEDQHIRLEFAATLIENCRETTIDGFGSFIREPEEDDARLVEDAERESVAEVEIDCQDDTRICAGTINQFRIRGTLQPQRADVNRFVAKLRQELNGLGRDPGVGQEPHRSGANRVELTLSEDSRVGERLANILSIEIRKVRQPIATVFKVKRSLVERPVARPCWSASLRSGW
jgi:hypothetical protein